MKWPGAGRIVGACCIVASQAIAARAQLPAGAEFQVNAIGAGLQRKPAPAFLPDGRFVVSWMDGLQVQEGEIAARRYSAAGTPVGVQFVVNLGTPGYQSLPAAAAAPDGRFVFAWTSYNQGPVGVWLRAYDAQGTPAGPEQPVNTDSLNTHWLPQVAQGGDGFLVAWLGNGVHTRLFDASGMGRGTDFRVNTYTANYAVSVAGWRGGFLVAWSSPHLEGIAEVFARRVDREGTPVGGIFQVNNSITGYQARPSVAAAADGTFVVAWESSFQDGDAFGIMARSFAPDGVPLGPEMVVNTFTTGYQRYPSVAADAQGGFVVTWASRVLQEPSPDGSRSGVFARRLARGGRPLGAEFRVNTYTTGRQEGQVVSGLPDGRILVTWTSEDQDGDRTGVFAQRYGSMAPVGLEVDLAGSSSDGNRVFEPGETTVVAPAWRNLHAGIVSATGTAFAFGGPGTGSYAIVDGGANYGTLAPGSTASCSPLANCYELHVGSPASRPSVHWDARFDEDLSLPRSASWRVHLGDSFSDVPRSSPYYRHVETVLHHGVTGGCGGTAYCAAAATSREQMAAFLLAAKEGPGYAPPACAPPNVFEDVPESSPFCRWIEELARRGVTGGCDATRYCPGAGVTREQMAVFLLRTLEPALDPPACGTPVFSDVPASSVYCRWIEELFRRGITGGCAAGRYCPADVVTREQMAAFLGVTFSLALYPA